MYIFGYGSLVNIKSAQKSFKRELKEKDFIEVKISNYKKIWNSIEHIVFENEIVETNGIFLNLCERKGVSTNGVLLKITDEEFEFLKLREKNYSYIQIDSSLCSFKTREKIYTFITTKKEKIAEVNLSNCYIPKKYIELLEENLNHYSKSFQEEFKNSYTDFPFEIKDGKYKFADPIQNKFAKDGIK